MTMRYAVRLLGSDGMYPRKPLVVGPFGVLAFEEFGWSAVRLAPEPPGALAYDPGPPVGEISWLQPPEIRFFAAASLAEAHPRTRGRLRIYTRSFASDLELVEPFSVDRLVAESRAIAADLYKQLAGFDEYGDVPNERPELLRRDFTAETQRLLTHMDATDALLHRGLYKLLMSTELRRYYKFLEESALSALISREAALELLRRKLSAATGQRLRLEDVMSHVEQTFPSGPFFVDALREDWDARVMMAHPVSEHGEHWSPPVEADACYDALHTLTYLYRYLLLDEVWKPAKYD